MTSANSKKLWPTLRRAIRRARRDVNAFARLCFADAVGRPLRPAAVHRELQAFLSDHPRALIELPRDHGKSTQIGIRLLWELGRQPGLRIRIVCASEAMAAERGRFLRDAIAGNRRVRLVFPWLRPAAPWEPVRFAVARPASVIGPSVAALGIGVRSTGSRADLIVCDDIVDVTALRSAAERARVKQFFRENLINLLEPDGRLWYVFTPWHRDDLGAELVAAGGFAHFRRAVGPDLEPVWPEHWSRERLVARRAEVGPAAFARGYRLICAADDDAAIRPDWLHVWTAPAPLIRTLMAVDPAASTAARADRTAVVVLGQAACGTVRCLAAVARRVAAPDLVAWLDALDAQWNCDVVIFESHGGFAALRDVVAAHARCGRKLRGLTHAADKPGRIRAFAAHLQAGRFLLRGDGRGGIDPAQQALADELLAFPLGDHDDLADAAAFGAAWLLNRPEPRAW
jgi:phage terminase large subunit-like protein